MTSTEPITMQQFLKAHNITMTSERVDSNPNMPSRDMDHWKVTLRRPHHTLTTYFSMGFGHNGKEPKADEVLDCLASDANGANQNTFEDWCSEYGYDTDSRKAERTYKACEYTCKRLRTFLDGNLDTLFYGTERM